MSDLRSVLALYFAPTRSKTKESVHFFVDQAVEFVARDAEPPLSSVVALLEEDDSLEDFFFKRIVPQKNGDLRCPCRWYSKKEDGDHNEEVIGMRTVTSNKKRYRFGDSYQCFPRYFPGGIFLGKWHQWRLSAIRRCPSDKEIVLVGIRVTKHIFDGDSMTPVTGSLASHRVPQPAQTFALARAAHTRVILITSNHS